MHVYVYKYLPRHHGGPLTGLGRLAVSDVSQAEGG